MYARYTELEFDPAARDQVMEMWETVGIPSAARQPGWRASHILDSVDTPGTLRLLTLWDAPEDFDRYYTSEEHQALGAAIKAAGLKGVKRDGLQARYIATRPGSVVRITRAEVPTERVAAVESYWRETGGPLTRAAAGCLRADGYWSAPNRFELLVEWTSAEHAQAFLRGPDHISFRDSMDSLGTTVTERIVGDRIA